MNSSKLLRITAHEAESPTEVSLREAFSLLQPQLKPPFPLSIPSSSEYSQLNHAIAFGILTEPHLAKTHLTHLHAIIIDGYNFFTTTLLKLCNESYPKLLETTRIQLLWLTSHLVQVAAVRVESLIISLLRQIVGGDFSDSNLWLCVEIVNILFDNWDWMLDEPLVLTSALFVYLRLLADHYRLMGSVKLDALKRMEIDFCIKALRECFSLCLRIGRDLVRLLQDLVYIPEFRDVWMDLLFDSKKFQVPNFTDISELYQIRTPTHYFLLRITLEMEAHLRFLLTHVKWGSQKRYQSWFVKKHLCCPGSETVITDIIRFICCAHHPPNEIIQSNVISRWAIIGWLLKSCRRNYIEANAKLALFYDWLFYDGKVDSIMNIEPAMLLMVNSVPKYIDITHTLLEFLFLLADNYNVSRKEVIVRGVSTAFDLLVRKGVVHSLELLTSCTLLSPFLRERLITFLPRSDSEVVKASSNTWNQSIVTDEEIFSSKDGLRGGKGKEGEGKEKSKAHLAKELLAKYWERGGGVLIRLPSSPSLISFSLCYLLVCSAIDVQALLNKEGIATDETGGKVGMLELFYATHQAALPVRFPLIIALTPIVAGWIGKKRAKTDN